MKQTVFKYSSSVNWGAIHGRADSSEEKLYSIFRQLARAHALHDEVWITAEFHWLLAIMWNFRDSIIMCRSLKTSNRPKSEIYKKSTSSRQLLAACKLGQEYLTEVIGLKILISDVCTKGHDSPLRACILLQKRNGHWPRDWRVGGIDRWGRRSGAYVRLPFGAHVQEHSNRWEFTWIELANWRHITNWLQAIIAVRYHLID